MKLSGSVSTLVELSRIDRLAGTMLAFWPYAWSLTALLCDQRLSHLKFFNLLSRGFVGSALLHSAGCIWNDILDRNLDKKVARTRNRPIASGRVSVTGALALLVGLLCTCLLMVCRVTSTAWKFSLVSIFVLPGIYPLLKRITDWPQAWLGIAMNTGVPMAHLLIYDGISRAIIPLYGACWFWTIYYDTIYASQDKRDDVNASIGSTALAFGGNIKMILHICGAVMLSLMIAFGIVQGLGLAYFLISIAFSSLYLLRQLSVTDFDNPRSCLREFENNAFYFGAIIWSGMYIDALLRA